MRKEWDDVICIFMLGIGELILLGICAAQQAIIDRLKISDRILWQTVDRIEDEAYERCIHASKPERVKEQDGGT